MKTKSITVEEQINKIKKMTNRELVGFIYYYLFNKFEIKHKMENYIGICKNGCMNCAAYSCTARDAKYKRK